MYKDYSIDARIVNWLFICMYFFNHHNRETSSTGYNCETYLLYQTKASSPSSFLSVAAGHAGPGEQ